MKKTKLCCVGLIICAIIIKLLLFQFKYVDYVIYLDPWIKYMTDNGYFSALKDAFHNYTLTYIYVLLLIAKSGLYPLYTIKTVSVIFEFIAAFFIGKIAYTINKKKIVIWLSMAIIPILPTVLLNSSFQSQCDSIYASFVIASVYFLFKDKRVLAIVLLGIAFSLKAQTAMILPFYFIYMLRGNIKWYYFLIVPLIYFISVLPAWIAGRSLIDLLTIYANQSVYNKELVEYFANIYKITGPILNNEKIYGVVFVFLLTLLTGFILSNKKYIFTKETWVKFIFLSTITVPFFLPGMLERYMYLGDLFGILYILVIRKKIYLPIGIIMVSFYSYIRCIYHYTPHNAYTTRKIFSIFESIPWEVVSFLYGAIILITAIDFYKTLKANQLNKDLIKDRQ